MTMLDFGHEVMARLDELARCTSEEGRLTRLSLTPAHKAAATEVQRWMEEAGMTARLDAIGNVVGRYEGSTPGLPALLLGSHIDTVPDAGKYDGMLGVITAIAAVAELHRQGQRLPLAVEVLAFGDEEGVRFPTGLSGSRAVAGTFDHTALDRADAQGVPFGQALKAFGGDPDAVSGMARRPDQVLGFVEVHIEQGPVLETMGLPAGVVTTINGASRFKIEVMGEAGHAGTVPMGLRKDALAAAAEMILAVERRAAGAPEPGLVATVGQIVPRPGATNVIPGRVLFTLDVRAPDDEDRHKAVDDLTAAFATLAARRHVGLAVEKTYDEHSVLCDPGLSRQLAAALARTGVEPHYLPSGAGHDAMTMAALCPVAMLFVRCKRGISHHPEEAIRVEDADLAVRVLLDLLRTFQPRP